MCIDQDMEYYNARAGKLHGENPAVDAHLDLAGEILLRNEAGERDIIQTCYLDNWKKAGIRLIASSLFIETNRVPEMALRMAMAQLEALYRETDRLEDVIMIKNRQDLNAVTDKNKIGILVYMEGMEPVGRDLRLLRPFYEMGVRGAGLTWSRRNDMGEGCCKAGELVNVRGGLSALGREAVDRMKELGMFLDVSHLNDDGFDELAGYTDMPFIASHSNARAVHFNYRNLTDEQIMDIARRGGVIGINAYKQIAGCRPLENPLEALCRHIEYIIQLAGEDHVGYGFDLCDSYSRAQSSQYAKQHDCLADHRDMVSLTAMLLKRGMEEETVKKIMGRNFIRYFKTVLL